MPAQPSRIQRLLVLLEAFSGPDAPLWWDRPAIETLFRLRRRQAISLLRYLGAQRIGTGYMVERPIQVRTARIATALGRAQRGLAAPRIEFSVPFDPDRLDFAGLPPGIQLARHQLTISFQAPADLLEKLFALSQALLNDYDSFEAALQDPEGT